MSELDQDALHKMLDQMREFLLVFLDELKEAPKIPLAALEALPAARSVLEQAFQRSRSAELAAEIKAPLIAAVQTIPLEVEARQAFLSDDDQEALLESLSEVAFRVLGAFWEKPEFMSALDEFLNEVVQPALERIFAERSAEVSVVLVEIARGGLRAWRWDDAPKIETPPSRLEDYFDFLAEDDIRIKGTRIGVEHVLYQAIHRSLTPKQIVNRYETLTLEKVYATLLFYERRKEELDAYLTDHAEFSQRVRRQFWENPPEVAEKLWRAFDRKRSEKRIQQAAKA